MRAKLRFLDLLSAAVAYIVAVAVTAIFWKEAKSGK
jgi:hypothetical protein